MLVTWPEFWRKVEAYYNALSGTASLLPLIFTISFIRATIEIEGRSWRLKISR